MSNIVESASSQSTNERLSEYLKNMGDSYNLSDFADFGTILGELNEEGYGTILEYLVESQSNGNKFTDAIDVKNSDGQTINLGDDGEVTDTDIAELGEFIEGLEDDIANEDYNWDDADYSEDDAVQMVKVYNLGNELLEGLPSNVSNKTKMGILTMSLSPQGLTMIMELASTYNQNLQTVGSQMSNSFKSNVRSTVQALAR